MLYEALFVPPGHPKYPRSVLKKPELQKYVESWGQDVYDVAIVATHEDELIGAIWGRKFKSEKKGYGYVDDNTPEISIAIFPSYRNQGIGTSLMAQIEGEYLTLGVTQLSLSVDKINPAKNLYDRCGYQVIEEQETAVTMIKQLKRAM